ncbi:MAG TPA: hypothetical protein VIJ07_26105 [Dermatophilaceae bacterium]|jgi:hypothetical protein
MKSRKLSLSAYLTANLPSELWWFNRPPHGALEDDWHERRKAWCAIHHVDGLTLLRHDAAAKFASPNRRHNHE